MRRLILEAKIAWLGRKENHENMNLKLPRNITFIFHSLKRFIALFESWNKSCEVHAT
jgi:hypothetical protein